MMLKLFERLLAVGSNFENFQVGFEGSDRTECVSHRLEESSAAVGHSMKRTDSPYIYASSAFPAISPGVIILGEIFAYMTVFQSNHRGSHIPSSWIVHAGCVFIVGLHLFMT